MSDDHRLAKVEILIQQKKYSEAENLLRDLLSQDSNNVMLLALLAEVNMQLGKYDIATKILDNAIGIAPGASYLFYNKTRVNIQQEKYDAAEANIKQAIELDPQDADNFALAATIKLTRKQFEQALELSAKALAINSENLLALNTRSTALLKLNKKEESFQVIQGALREDPNNAYTHANYGWGLLEKGDYKKAKEHFKEALQNDPNYPYAQAGLLEALKATNPVYRLFLKYAFFMGNLTAKYQWGVIIGFYIGSRALNALAANNETLRPYLVPLTILLALVAFSTWVITPIGNLFLRFNKYGQLLLDKNEKLSSNFVAASFLLFVVGGILYLVSGNENFLAVVAFGFAMMPVFGAMFRTTKYKHALPIYSIAMVGVGLLAITTAFSSGELVNTWSTIFIFGFIAFQWGANFLIIREGNK